MDDREGEEEGGEGAPTTWSGNNPSGVNQYKDCPAKGDISLENLLRNYHRKTTNTKTISRMLYHDHGYQISPRTIARRLKDLGLTAALKTERALSSGTINQLIVDQMDRDPSGKSGPSTIKQEIARTTGYHINYPGTSCSPGPRRSTESGTNCPTGHSTAASGSWTHFEWAADGHDKLVKYGFPIWGIRDKYTRKWLGLWVVPNNRLALVVAYLWLLVVLEYGGIPMQTTTDCGSENTIIYGLAKALMNAFAEAAGRAHFFLRSIHNIVIERGWLDVWNAWGCNIPLFFGRGEGIYDEDDETHRLLALWLWPPLIQNELDDLQDKMNNRTMRKQKQKATPSGVSPNIAYSTYSDFGGVWCLQAVDRAVVQEIMDDIIREQDPFDWGVPEDFAIRCQAAFDTLQISTVTLQNVWTVFTAILELL